jgi:hypothetical protein
MKRLIKSEIDATIQAKWEAIPGIPEEDEARHMAVQDAIDTQASLCKQYKEQEIALDILWELCEKIIPGDPIRSAHKIGAQVQYGIREGAVS